MTHAISIATASHFRLARRLAVSLAKRHPDWRLTLYCEDSQLAERALGLGPWRCVNLPSIARVGAKRAKFDAYVDAIRSGPFVWLDADVIVLDSLQELVAQSDDELVACPDDLSECDFIADPQYPWAADPSLRADVYFNSGVFGAGAGLAPFLEDCMLAAQDPTRWAEWTIEGRLLDNHFLCAMVHRERIDVRKVESRQFNWQGLRRRDQVMVRALNGRLINIETGRPLHVAHFAGVPDVDAWLRLLPPAELVCFASAVTDGGEDLLAALGAASAGQDAGDDAVKAGFMFARPQWLRHGDAAGQSAPEARDVLSFIRSVPASDVRWNGLPCGGAYLEASEYAFLRDITVGANIGTVVEVGAGYTSALFRRTGANVVSIEPNPGPWVDVARAAGADVRLVPFDSSAGLFDAQALAEALPGDAGNNGVGLLFIDSPNGTWNRRQVLRQLRERISPRLVAFHDAHRDAEIVFAAAEAGWQLAHYLPTWRGLVVLQLVGQTAVVAPVHEEAGRLPQVVIKATASRPRFIRCTIRNVGSDALLATGPLGWRLSYHLEPLSPEGVRRWDNVRTVLPCSLAPGDEIEVPVAIEDVPGEYDCWFDLVQEGVCWMSEVIPDLRASTLRLGVEEGRCE